MKVAVSLFANDSGRSGIGVYMIRLVEELARRIGRENILLYGCEEDFSLFDTTGYSHHAVRRFWSRPLFNLLWHLFIFPLRLLVSRPDVVFMPAGNRRLPLWSPAPVVATVHDLSQLHIPAKYDRFRMWYVLRVLPFLMRRATRVITVSRATQQDVVEYARVSPDRVSVIYNGIDHSRYCPMDVSAARAEIEEAFGVSSPYLLYTARLEHPGKNHVNLLRAFNEIQQRAGREIHLVFAGKDAEGAEAVHQEFQRLSIADRVHCLGFVPDENMRALYAGAEALVFPSRFEGFGLPLIEAMACGTAVACSDIPVFHEIGETAAAYFDPESPEDIARVVSALLMDDSSRQTRRQAGLEIVKKYSWERAGKQTLEILSRVGARRLVDDAEPVSAAEKLGG